MSFKLGPQSVSQVEDVPYESGLGSSESLAFSSFKDRVVLAGEPSNVQHIIARPDTVNKSDKLGLSDSFQVTELLDLRMLAQGHMR